MSGRGDYFFVCGAVSLLLVANDAFFLLVKLPLDLFREGY